ncbi:MAG: hypothetical protein IAB19_07920 [Proteobacteria bacterium]|uniref:Uncharacterized protein n=1 Tax=Candidatus Avisuccinivibrio stercorigallinarum TaxID=2840704 RepID=A0A9D9GT81_9GAMM|nr:hypothetical protein [Candidatus Avisuccinivibrio stercorigallinarum]
MPDKLEWLNQHFVLLKAQKVAALQAEQKLPLNTQLAELALDFPAAEDFIKELGRLGKFKDGCGVLCYALHQRAAMWWAYCCVLDLRAELIAAPQEPRDIADIAKPRELKVPKWAQPLPEQPPSPEEQKAQQDLSKLVSDVNKLNAQIKRIVPPRLQELFDNAQRQSLELIKKETGTDLQAVLKEAVELFGKESALADDEDALIDPQSPILKAEAELKGKLEAVRVKTVDLIKQALPEPDLKRKALLQRNCLDGVFDYIAAPDEGNAARLLELGNSCPDTPEGMLALAGYWSFGDLAPAARQVVPTPPGLMANGLNALLLQCALKAGGRYTFAERYERYFILGVETACGRSSWGPYVEQGQSKHALELANIKNYLQGHAGQSKDKGAQSASAADDDHPVSASQEADALSAAQRAAAQAAERLKNMRRSTFVQGRGEEQK